MRYPAIAFLGSAARRRYPLLTTMVSGHLHEVGDKFYFEGSASELDKF